MLGKDHEGGAGLSAKHSTSFWGEAATGQGTAHTSTGAITTPIVLNKVLIYVFLTNEIIDCNTGDRLIFSTIKINLQYVYILGIAIFLSITFLIFFPWRGIFGLCQFCFSPYT